MELPHIHPRANLGKTLACSYWSAWARIPETRSLSNTEGAHQKKKQSRLGNIIKKTACISWADLLSRTDLKNPNGVPCVCLIKDEESFRWGGTGKGGGRGWDRKGRREAQISATFPLFLSHLPLSFLPSLYLGLRLLSGRSTWTFPTSGKTRHETEFLRCLVIVVTMWWVMLGSWTPEPKFKKIRFWDSNGLGCSSINSDMFLCCSYIRALGAKHGNKEWEEESESLLLLLLFSYIYENFDSSNMLQMIVDRVWSQIWTHD